jgi:hypothetical protein
LTLARVDLASHLSQVAVLAGFLLRETVRCPMRYIVAWLLGVPLGVIVLWYIVGHAACG